MREAFKEMLTFRHATKSFSDKKVSREDLNYILEAGQMAPSSFGVEPWKFLVVQGEALKLQLKAASFNQAQVGNASAVIVLLTRKDLYLNDGYVEPLLRRVGDDLYENFYKAFYEGYTEPMTKEQITDWGDKQTHLAAMNMMNAAAAIGIDSCPIGGTDPAAVAELLGVDTSIYVVSMLLPVGYREHEPYPKNRRGFEDVVTFID